MASWKLPNPKEPKQFETTVTIAIATPDMPRNSAGVCVVIATGGGGVTIG